MTTSSRCSRPASASSRTPPDITGEHLYAEVSRLADKAGWELGGRHAGHLVGEFPHERIDGADTESYITPANDTPLRRTDKALSSG
ncbi:hypothetical protein [Streptomyces sp. NBC_00243]|uniref:hypothetical protein n=1 Tax=Streptomyces sp. NBC_00243 TaxID=2975688 RepID=UPI003FA36FB4